MDMILISSQAMKNAEETAGIKQAVDFGTNTFSYLANTWSTSVGSDKTNIGEKLPPCVYRSKKVPYSYFK